jgi:RNA polymerase sigma-70 factor (ECF subfamily)
MVDDRAAMEIAQLVAEHHQAVYRYAYRLTGSVPDAEDLTQQVFLNAQQKLAQVRQQERVRAWLFAILRNCFLKSCRKRRPVPAANLKLNIDSLPAAPLQELLVEPGRLQAAIDDLPPRYRVVVTMFYFENASYRQISEQLHLPMGTVMSRLARAKGHLRDELFPADQRPAVPPPTRPANSPPAVTSSGRGG